MEASFTKGYEKNRRDSTPLHDEMLGKLQKNM
jgi:hypothetical protein